MSARDEVLARIRGALADRPAAGPIPRGYRGAQDTPGDADLFAERVADYRATVHRCGTDEIGARVSAIVTGLDRHPVLVPADLPTDWTGELAVEHDDQRGATELDRAGGVVTGCAVAIAETGTIVLDHGPRQGRRALTLVPDYHLVVVLREQIRADVPDAIAALDPGRPLTWISGPSATSDIELNRVEGVHGPRTLDVLIAG